VTRHQDRGVARRAYVDLLDRQALSLPDLVRRGRVTRPAWAPDELPDWAQAQHDADPALVLDGDVIPTPPWPGLLSDLRRAGVPVLVVTGSGPGIGITEQHRSLAAGHGARIAVVSGASHFVRRDAPVEFLRVTLEFLADAV
jgi:pimeloyl-ACP methyl ester carboxylesterase